MCWVHPLIWVPGRIVSSTGIIHLVGWVSLLEGLLVAHSRLPEVVMEAIRTASLKQAKGSLKYGKFNRGPPDSKPGLQGAEEDNPQVPDPYQGSMSHLCLDNQARLHLTHEEGEALDTPGSSLCLTAPWSQVLATRCVPWDARLKAKWGLYCSWGLYYTTLEDDNQAERI